MRRQREYRIFWNRGQGRYWKRKLSKLRRKYHKEKLRGHNPRYPTWIESECNYKGY